MADKRDISRLLKKGLTGWEAGLLVLEDSWLESRNEENFLTERDIASLKAGLQTQQDIQDYNKLIQLYRTTDFIERQADLALFAATAELERAAGLGYLREAPIVAQATLHLAPQIMTEKQYREERQAIIDRQRQRKLQELESMDTVHTERALRLAPEGWRDELAKLEKEDPDEAPDEYSFIEQKYPEAFVQAVQDILDLIQAGRLRPVQLSQEDRQKLISMEEQLQAYRERRWPPGQTKEELIEQATAHKMPPGWTRDEDIKWTMLFEEKEGLTKEAYQRASKDSQKSLAQIISSLEQLRAGSLPEDEEETLLDYTFFLGEDLYQAGLPEWKESIDTYWPRLYEDDLDESSVAIIPKPKDTDLDERGYYNRKGFEHWPFAPMEVDELEEVHADVSRLAKEQIEKLLARRQVLREVSLYIGLDLAEAIDFAISEILRPAIGRYNGLAEAASLIDRWPFENYQKVKHIRIDLEKLKPRTKSLAQLRGWISEALGEQWWKRAETEHREPRSIMKWPGHEKEAEDGA